MTCLALACALCSNQSLRAAEDKPQVPGNDDNEGMTIGMNLSAVKDWSRAWVFVDVFKTSRPWIAQKPGGGGVWGTQEKLELTSRGWPLLKEGQAAGTLMWQGTNGHYPGGNYLLTFEGKGRIFISWDAHVRTRVITRPQAVNIKPSKRGVFLRIEQSDRRDPIRNIRLMMPGFEKAASPFHPTFIERLRPFGVIRFMNWQHTNNSPLAHWADRTTPQSARQSGPNGVALEYMIGLCNEIGAAPWFCMPHLADDEFVRNFAQLVKNKLRPDVKIYLEWTNEPWNSGLFAQGQWVRQQAKQRGVSVFAMMAEQFSRDARIWHEVFGDDKDRVIRVPPGHLKIRGTTRILDELDGEFDAVACGGYFGPQPQDKKIFDENTTSEQVLLSTMHRIENVTLPDIAQFKKLAARWEQKLGRPIPLLTTEAGQGIIPIGGFMGARRQFVPWKQVAWDCQTHPMMHKVYTKMLRGSREAGLELFMAYVYVSGQSKWGSWGHLQYQDDPIEKAPKFRALLDMALPLREGDAATPYTPKPR